MQTQNPVNLTQALLDSTHANGEKFPIWNARKDPHKIYSQMRETYPIMPLIGPVSGNTFWIVTGYDESVAALKHAQIGKDFRPHLTPEQLAKFPPPPDELAMIDRHLLNLDPPDHTRLRALVHKAFTPALMENMRSRVQTIADDLIEAALARNTGEIDLISEYGFPLPITVIAELLGIPSEDRLKFREWTKALLFGDSQESARFAAFEFIIYMNNLIDERQVEPKPDLLTALVQAEDAGDKLDRMELMSMIFLLLVAGHETTVNLIGNGIYELLRHPDQLKMLRDNPTLLKSAVEEILRFNGPVETATTRWAFEDIEIGGVTIPFGDMLLISLHGANRDPRVFANPDVFDITREPNRHIAFGNGIHYCVGAPLARIEGAIAIQTLITRLPELSATPEMIENAAWSDNILLHGLKEFQVQF